MKKSIGIIEVTGSANAICVIDMMLKTAEVEYISWETVFGLGRVTVFIQGDVASVATAVETVKNNNECVVFASHVIANPHSETQKFLARSQKKFKEKIQ